MFKATIPGLLNKSRTLVARRFGSETQNLVAQMIFNDDVNVLTTFDMNRVASVTFRLTGRVAKTLSNKIDHGTTLGRPFQEFRVPTKIIQGSGCRF